MVAIIFGFGLRKTEGVRRPARPAGSILGCDAGAGKAAPDLLQSAGTQVGRG